MQHEIISKIREFIRSENLRAGDQLPSDSSLAERFGVSKTKLNRAVQKLELYGLLRTRPQIGTIIADVGKLTLDGMLGHILRLKEPDFKSLIEIRIELELSIVQFAAERRREEQLQNIKEALDK